VVIEGMAAGKPVIATKLGGVPEIVLDGLTGLLVPMGNAPAMASAICALLADKDRRLPMGQLGWARVLDHFTTKHVARKVEQAYATVLRRACNA